MITLAYGRTKRKKRKEKRTSEYLLVFAYGDGGDKSCQPAGDFHGQHESRRNRERRPTFCNPPDLRLGIYRFQKLRADERQKEFAYDATAVIALFISLIHFNVRNYTFMQDYTDENTYIIWVSVFAALYLAIAFICLILTFLNFHSRKKTNEILLRDGDCVDCQLRVPYRVQLQHDGYDILGAAETYGDSGRLRR